MTTDGNLVAAACAALLAAAGCSSQVTISHSGGGASGATGSGVGGATTTGGGGAPVCDVTHERFDLTLETAFAGVFSCAEQFDSEEGLHQLDGEVTESSGGTLVIDSCPPGADCFPWINKLSFSAPGLDVAIPVGAFVHLEARVEIPFGCTHELLITNLPNWAGVPNPINPQEQLYVAGSDGAPVPLPGAPFTVQALSMACSEPVENDLFVLHFTSPFAEASQGVPMGTTASWEWNAAPSAQLVEVRNLRSYESGLPDDFWNWGFWLAGHQVANN